MDRGSGGSPQPRSAAGHAFRSTGDRRTSGASGHSPSSSGGYRLKNGLAAKLFCHVNAQDEVALLWMLGTNEVTRAIAQIGDQPPREIGGEGTPANTGVMLDSTDRSGDHRMTTLDVPDMNIVSADGSEIRITNAQTHLNTDEAFCTGIGTLTVVEPVEPTS